LYGGRLEAHLNFVGFGDGTFMNSGVKEGFLMADDRGRRVGGKDKQ
jgi:hypothetical protein